MLRNWALRPLVAPPPTANLAAWYQKNTGITAAANFVSQWSDASGNARHLLQATGANQPVLQADGTILFDGAAQYLKANGFTFNQPETIYMRFRQVTWTLNNCIFDGNTFVSMLGQQTPTTPSLRINGGVAVATNGDLAVNTYASACFIFNGAGSLIQIGSNTPTTGDAGALNGGGFTLGAAGSGTLFANIQVAEVLLYSVAHNAAQRAQVIAYLNTK